MKTKLISLMASVLACGVMAQDANQMKYVQLLPANCSTNLSVTGSIIDIAGYKGNATLVVNTGASSGMTNTITVTLQHSTAANFANPNTVTNLAGTAGVLTETCGATVADTENLQTFAIDTARLRKYIRVIYTTTLAENYIPVSAMLVAPMKSE